MWLNLGNPYQSPEDLLEGSPVDRTVFLVLMTVGLVVLCRRNIYWGAVFRNNIWLVLYFLYCGISVVWSEFPLVSGKRWIKALGDPMMVLIVLTEREPLKALEIVIKRCAFILIPLSILFIKYYPHLGKAYGDWTGADFYIGVTTNKNTLGMLCFAFGLFYFGRLCYLMMEKHEPSRKTDMIVISILMFMLGWCLYMVDSMTPLLSLMLAVIVFIALGCQNVRRNVGTFMVMALVGYAVLEFGFNTSEEIIVAAGRDPTLTGRTELWDVVLHMQQEPLLGYGFESFWLGDRLKKLWDMYYFKPNMAHNGYLEMFLNLGLIGLGLFLGLIVSAYNSIGKKLKVLPESGKMERIDIDRFRMAFLVGFLIFNITEGGFRSLNFIFVFFLLLVIGYPRVQPRII